MSTSVVISVEGIGKSYLLNHQARERYVALRDVIADKFKSLFRPRKLEENTSATIENFWALKGVSFEVKKGDVVGIMGRNGSGKSTLLKILSRITEPTEGVARIKGRVASLLEVGTGFHPELTGRENIFLNGAILGMSRAEIRKKFDEIVAFAEVEKFLDTPVKRYSSGMYVRLAFAVAAHLEPEILVIDEVLAVGDAEFQRKCLGKIKDVATGGRTVLFVSHHVHSIAQLCNRGIVLAAGKVACAGDIKTAVDHYTTSTDQGLETRVPPTQRYGSGEYRFIDVQPTKEVFDPAEVKSLSYTIKSVRGQIGKMYVSAHLFNESGFEILHLDSRLVGCWLDDSPSHQGTLHIKGPWLRPGKYRVDVYIFTPCEIVDFAEGACYIYVSNSLPYPSTVSGDGLSRGVVLGDFEWK